MIMIIFLMLINLSVAQVVPLTDNNQLQTEQEQKRIKAEEDYQRLLDAKKNEIRSDMERKKYDKNYQE